MFPESSGNFLRTFWEQTFPVCSQKFPERSGNFLGTLISRYDVFFVESIYSSNTGVSSNLEYMSLRCDCHSSFNFQSTLEYN